MYNEIMCNIFGVFIYSAGSVVSNVQELTHFTAGGRSPTQPPLNNSCDFLDEVPGIQ